MLENEFMRLALGAGAIVGVLAPAVGFFLVQRRQSLMGDGIGHVAFAGVAAGILLDVSPVLTALVAAVLGGLAIELLRSRGRTAGDQALAIVFYTGIALGVVLVAQAGALNVDLFQYLFGSILTVTRSDLAVIAVLGAVGLVTVATLYRAFAAIVIDEEGARVAGVPIGTLNVALATLTAVTVALSMRVVGILLVAALMVLPVSAAARIAWSMRSTLVLAMAIGLGAAISGLTVSYYADLPPGGTIVLAAAAAYLSLASSLARGRPRGETRPTPRRALLRPRDSRDTEPRTARRPHHDRLARVRRRQSVHETLGRRRHRTGDRPLAACPRTRRATGARHRSEREPPEVLVEPATTTRTPLLASSSACPTIACSRNWTSSIPTTSNPDARAGTSSADATGTARIRAPAWLTTSVASYRSSMCGFRITTRWPAISARRNRRIISSLFPLNIGPQMTSSQPPRCGGMRITGAIVEWASAGIDGEERTLDALLCSRARRRSSVG